MRRNRRKISELARKQQVGWQGSPVWGYLLLRCLGTDRVSGLGFTKEEITPEA